MIDMSTDVMDRNDNNYQSGTETLWSKTAAVMKISLEKF